ncbi:MAG: TIGR01620 family protein [Pseudomonadota bacterium]|jgi:putative membrane protein|nr:TIGR01620 family protein [Pseudomonadota bacterium]MEC8292064.1 TIGR01620 family protein [Pseudomonadota bacterium]
MSDSPKQAKGPILIDLDEAPDVAGPEAAPPVPDIGLPADSAQTGLQMAATWAGRKPSRLGRWILALLVSFLSALAALAAWDAVVSLIGRVPVLGYAVGALGAALVLAVVLAVIGELAALARLGRVEALQRSAEEALAEADLAKAQKVSKSLMRLYQRRQDLDWARGRFDERRGEQMDADALLGLAEQELLAPLDKLAEAEVQAAARQVATVTALVPLALADVLTALTANLRMIRRVAEIYGGRSGTLGSWRLFSAVMAHLVATGAVAIGDDLLGSLAGGGLLSKLSRRFGEGVVNGALTVRVGVAAMEVCRPLPYARRKRPSVSAMVGAALGGLFTGRGSV